MKTFKECLADGEKDWLGLTKITGMKIKEVTGYITSEFGDLTFKLVDIVMEDGTEISCEGEHDMPYIAPCSEDERKKLHMTEEELENIHKTDPDYEENDE